MGHRATHNVIHRACETHRVTPPLSSFLGVPAAGGGTRASADGALRGTAPGLPRSFPTHPGRRPARFTLQPDAWCARRSLAGDGVAAVARAAHLTIPPKQLLRGTAPAKVLLRHCRAPPTRADHTLPAWPRHAQRAVGWVSAAAVAATVGA